MSVDLVNPDIAERGGRIVHALMEGGAGAWSTLIGRDVAYAETTADYGRPAEVVRTDELGQAVVTPVKWSGDTSGRVYLLVPAEGARQIVAHMMALMFGGEANVETTALDEAGMDAWSEAAGSFFGQGVHRVRADIGGTIRTAVSDSFTADFGVQPAEETVEPDDYYRSRIKVTIEGHAPFILELLLSRSLTGGSRDTETGSGKQAEEAMKMGIDPVNLAIAMKIKLPIVVGIAQKKMRMELIQDMTPGTIIEFKKMSGENLDVIASNIKIAAAEAVIINGFFGVQIRNIVDPRAQTKD